MTTEPQIFEPVGFRDLMERVEDLVRDLKLVDDELAAITRLAEELTREVGAEMGIVGGRIYFREEDEYRVWGTFGQADEVARGVRVPVDYPPIQNCLTRGSVYRAADDPELDRDLESRLAAAEFAAVEVGEGDYVLAFDLSPDHSRDRVLFSLLLVRQSINSRIRHERIQDVFRQARRIQASILPREVPRFGGFDLAGRSVPLETVGGDFFDYIPISDKILGCAIADVAGHGLPAALQVRDIYMGLRMGMARDFKIVRTVERLNQIIHLSTVTSRFVSMFYGELEIDGNFIYVNAGHPPPFHLAADGSVAFLEKGGVILGPLPEASYTRGFVTLRPGDLLVFYTDGIVEARRPGMSEEYGVSRLLALTRENQGRSAAEVVDAVFADVDGFCSGDKPSDDRTVVVVSLPRNEPTRD